MKRNMIIGSALALAGIAAYFIRRRIGAKSSETSTSLPSPRSTHITNVFSNAKQHAMNP